MFSKEVLDQINIDSPCTADWDAMIGTDRVRFCGHCSLSVHDLSKITQKQALRLMARSRGRLCVRYIAGPDGRPIRKSSPTLHRIMRSTSRMAAGAFGISLTVASAAPTTTPNAQFAGTIACAEMSRELFAGGAVLSGYVYDPNGAVLTGALVALTNGIGVFMRTTTDSEGKYRFEGLEAGDYSIHVEANGFASADVTNIQVRADSENVINQTLSIGAIRAEVEITAPATETVQLAGAVAVAQPTEPLVRAAQSDDLEAVKQLLASRPNVNARDEHSDSTPLEHAVLNANREMIQLLIWAGADVNARDGSGRTPLMMLGDKITSDAVWDLINAGAKVNLRDEDGDTALIEAAGSNNLEVLRALLDAGAKVNTKNNDGETSLMHAASEGLVNNVRALILAGADINIRDNRGKTAWKRASENEHSPVLRLLRSYGVEEETKIASEPKE